MYTSEMILTNPNTLYHNCFHSSMLPVHFDKDSRHRKQLNIYICPTNK